MKIIKNLLLLPLLGACIPLSTMAQIGPPTFEAPKEIRAWLGVASSGVHPLLRQHLDLPEGFGVQITHVPEGTPAEKAGLKAGDVLSKFDDQLLTSPDHLTVLVRSKKKGDSVQLSYFRKGVEASTTAILEEKEVPKREPQMHGPDQLHHRMHDLHNQMQDMMKFQQHSRKFPPNNDGELPFPKFIPGQPGKNNRSESRSQSSSVSKGVHGPVIKNESVVKIKNDKGSIVITKTDGKGKIEITDAEGNGVYSGPFDTAVGIQSLPQKAQDHLKEMEVDNIDILAPTELKVLPPPVRDSGNLKNIL